MRKKNYAKINELCVENLAEREIAWKNITCKESRGNKS